MSHTRNALLALVFGLIMATSSLPAFSQDSGSISTTKSPSDAAARRRFELSAMVNAHASLSRADIDRNSLGMGSLAQPQKRANAPTEDNQIASIQGVPKADATAMPSGFVEEYQVDWSHWISSEADRWYYILKAAETTFGLEFVTERPAMIQFTCYADGTIGNVILRQSSGVPAYDRLQIETLKATQPLAPFPAGTRRNSITLCQGWESHPKRPGEADFQPGSFGRDFPAERVRQWHDGR